MNAVEFLQAFKPPLWFLNYLSIMWPLLLMLWIAEGSPR